MNDMNTGGQTVQLKQDIEAHFRTMASPSPRYRPLWCSKPPSPPCVTFGIPMHVLYIPKWYPGRNGQQLGDTTRKQAIPVAGHAQKGTMHWSGLLFVLALYLPTLAKAQVDPMVRVHIAPTISAEALRYDDLAAWTDAQGHPELGLSPLRYGLSLAMSNRWFFVNLQFNINGGVATNTHYKIDAAASAIQFDLGYSLLRSERSTFGPMLGLRSAHFAYGVQELQRNARYMPEFEQAHLLTGLSFAYGGRIALIAQTGVLVPMGKGSWTNLPPIVMANELGMVRASAFASLGIGIRVSKGKVQQDP